MQTRRIILAVAAVIAVAITAAPMTEVVAKGASGSSRSSGSSFKSFSSKPSSPTRITAPSRPSAPAPSTSTSRTQYSNSRPTSILPTAPSAPAARGAAPSASTSRTLWDRSAPARPAAAAGVAAGATAAAASAPPTSTAKTQYTAASAGQQSAKSFDAYKQKTAMFKKPAESRLNAEAVTRNPVVQNTRERKTYNEYYRGRDSYYAQRNWSPPTYVYAGQPSFGAWDALFLYSVLDSMNDRQMMMMMHNQAGDPGVKAWREEANKQAETNAELKAKLAALDAKLATLQNEPVDPNYVPPNVPKTVALAAEAVVGGGDGSIRMGTGSSAGVYHAFCSGDGRAMKGLANLTTGKVTCETTGGSTENLEGLASGKFDVVLAQADAVAEWEARHAGSDTIALKATAYPEYVQMLVNASGEIGSIKDLDPTKDTIYLAGTGARETWEGFVREDAAYGIFGKNKRLIDVPATEEVLKKVAADKNSVAIFVGGLHSPLLNLANNTYGSQLELAPVDDWDFNDQTDATGHPIYAFETIPKGLYPKLQESGYLWGSNDVETIVVPAVFVVGQKWVDANGMDGQAKLEVVLDAALAQARERAVSAATVQ